MPIVLHNLLQRIQKRSFDTLPVRLYNRHIDRKHNYTTPVWSWLGYGKLISSISNDIRPEKFTYAGVLRATLASTEEAEARHFLCYRMYLRSIEQKGRFRG